MRNGRALRWSAVALALLSNILCNDNNHAASAFSINVGAGRQQHLQLASRQEVSLGNIIHYARNLCYNQRAASLQLQPAVDFAALENAPSLPAEIKVQESHHAQQKIGENSSIIFSARTVEDDMCEGYLLQKLDNNFEVHISYSNVNVDVDQFIAVFHKLILQYISIEYELYDKKCIDVNGSGANYSSRLRVVLDGAIDAGLSKHLERIGFPLPPEPQQRERGGLEINLAKYIPFLNEYAFRHGGTEQGNTSLLALKMLSKRRVSFDFSAHEIQQDSIYRSERRRNNVISHQKQILPSYAIDELMDVVEDIKSRQWLSTNPDSVDGLPSLHLDLITNGKPLFEQQTEHGDGDDGAAITFPQSITKMVDILNPHLYDNLLPSVRELTNSSTVEISDVFIRNYGDQDESESGTRYGLSAHYDVTAYATCAIALDSTASTGRNGLYTIFPTSGSHAALRKFFRLERGDGVVHTYDVLHGVDVDPKLNRSRTSLIVWFTDGKDEDQSVNQPWLLNPTDANGEFILGLASESAVEEDGSHMMLKNAVDQYSLYLSSATRGNVFAMTSLAQMCDDGIVPESQYENILNILATRDDFNPFLSLDGNRSWNKLASALWYHAAIQGGYRVAQVSLADELMFQYRIPKDNLNPVEQENMLLMASVLFTMALVQGYDSKESLDRLMDVECDRLNTMGVTVPSEDYFASRVVQVLLMSM